MIVYRTNEPDSGETETASEVSDDLTSDTADNNGSDSMDWQFTSIQQVESLVQVLQAKCRFEDHELIDNELYALCRADDGRRFIVVAMLEQHPDGWAYILSDETMLPRCYRCPPRLLLLSDIPDVLCWRELCWISLSKAMSAGSSSVNTPHENASTPCSHQTECQADDV